MPGAHGGNESFGRRVTDMVVSCHMSPGDGSRILWKSSQDSSPVTVLKLTL